MRVERRISLWLVACSLWENNSINPTGYELLVTGSSRLWHVACGLCENRLENLIDYRPRAVGHYFWGLSDYA